MPPTLPPSLFDRLAQRGPSGYSATSPPATEPTVWLALAQQEAGWTSRADSAAAWLADLQLSDGSIGVTASDPTPQWPTSLSLLLWHQIGPGRYRESIDRAVAWALESRGTTIPSDPNIGHNTQLVGWSWASNTHSWLEPTAFFVMALRSLGLGDHPRVREGVELLVDRLLPDGGCNYGNTKVLGQYLVDHLQPSGIVMWTLAGEDLDDPRLEKTLNYLEQSLERTTGSASLAFALLGLAAWHRVPKEASDLIAQAWHRPTTQESPYRQALLWLAAQRTNAIRAKVDHTLQTTEESS